MWLSPPSEFLRISILLSPRSKQYDANRFRSGSVPAANQVRTSSEPDPSQSELLAGRYRVGLVRILAQRVRCSGFEKTLLGSL